MVDFVPGITELLLADSSVVALVGARVYGEELPRNLRQSESTPDASLVVKISGGIDLGGYNPLARPRIDLLAYGPTPIACRAVLFTAHAVLKYVKNAISAGVNIYSASPLSLPNGFREPNTEWPIATSSWELFVSEVAA